MGIDFRSIRKRLQSRLELFRLRVKLAQLDILKALTVKLGSPEHKEEFAAQWETHDQKSGEGLKSTHRWALYTSVGQALTQWAALEDLLVGIACLLLRTHEANKVGIVLYSIVNFNVWLGIIEELFSQEPLYLALKPTWNKLSSRLRGLKETRDRLAHHTIYEGDKAATVDGDTSLRPSQFDLRQKNKKYQPLNYEEISKFMESLHRVHVDLNVLLTAMTAVLRRETSQQKSSESTPGQPPP